MQFTLIFCASIKIDIGIEIEIEIKLPKLPLLMNYYWGNGPSIPTPTFRLCHCLLSHIWDTPFGTTLSGQCSHVTYSGAMKYKFGLKQEYNSIHIPFLISYYVYTIRSSS